MKRILDVVIAGAALLALSPILIIIGAAIKLTIGGPIIYRHERVGFGGKLFYCLKFRTMVADGDPVLLRYLESNPVAAEEWRCKRKLTFDPRVTPLGLILRKTSLDELPQLYNVLVGEMSCVGPRPIVVEELKRYGEYVHGYFRTRPGMTGLWQVSGRSSASYADRVQLDTKYIREWSFLGDIVILLRTPLALAKLHQAA